MTVYSDYKMGFAVNGTPIPDPTTYSGIVSDLDIFGERDLQGTLHRKRVATKEPLKLSWAAIPFTEAQAIVALTSGDSFQFTYRSMRTGQSRTMRAYRGADVPYEFLSCWDGRYTASSANAIEPCLVNLNLSIIEY